MRPIFFLSPQRVQLVGYLVTSAPLGAFRCAFCFFFLARLGSWPCGPLPAGRDPSGVEMPVVTSWGTGFFLAQVLDPASRRQRPKAAKAPRCAALFRPGPCVEKPSRRTAGRWKPRRPAEGLAGPALCPSAAARSTVGRRPVPPPGYPTAVRARGARARRPPPPPVRASALADGHRAAPLQGQQPFSPPAPPIFPPLRVHGKSQDFPVSTTKARPFLSAPRPRCGGADHRPKPGPAGRRGLSPVAPSCLNVLADGLDPGPTAVPARPGPRAPLARRSGPHVWASAAMCCATRRCPSVLRNARSPTQGPYFLFLFPTPNNLSSEFRTSRLCRDRELPPGRRKQGSPRGTRYCRPAEFWRVTFLP